MKKSHIRKKKAFTLTELLVVVIVIGVLSAVVLPKFSKVLETRKTTEAEEVLGAVRNEQEKRCILDHPYTGSFKVLGQTAEDTAKLESKYYTYALKQGGAEASSKGKAYTLELESYKDGRFCCSGPYCSSLNKDYPTCEELKGLSDYQGAEAGCLASLCEVAKECNPGEITTASCDQCGTKKKLCSDSCQWSGGWDNSGCYSSTAPANCSCADRGLCGTARKVFSCSGGGCDYSSCTSCCGGCSGSSTDYEYDYTSESRTCNSCGTQTRSASRYRTRSRSCNCDTWGSFGGWSSWSEWSWGGWGGAA